MDIPLDTILKTERCILRVVSEDDVECVWMASRFPDFTSGMTWDPAETKEEIIDHVYKSIENWKEGVDYGFSVYRNKPEECIGRIAIRKGGRG